MKTKIRKILLAIFVIFPLVNIVVGQHASAINLWQNGTGNYKNYRIPSLLLTKKGTLLAFCEGRKGGDSGDIDLLLKISTDNGATWSRKIIVWDDGQNTCGNPCPVVDEKNGRIWLFMTWNLGLDTERRIICKESRDTRRPFVCFSDDDGVSWSKPVDLSKTCKNPSWGWYATGPGVGIQLGTGKFKGRLLIPANHSYDDPQGHLAGAPFGYGSHVLISDDHGKTWKMSKPIRPQCNESQIVELSDGSLLMNMRSYNDNHCRAVSKSKDGGETWSDIRPDQQLVESRCQASLINYGAFNDENMFLFSNPAVPEGRTHMTIKTSFDDCNTWSNAKLIHAGPSAYSCMAKLPNGKIGILFEYGTDHRYDKIRFESFPPEMLFMPGTLLHE
ncbi:MAG: exo-alpha-sialidase [Calditrichaeota bacterium]|nr:exo-alpha-sialidase [Calditrichota bacterium]